MLSQFFLVVKIFLDEILEKRAPTYVISRGAMSDDGIFRLE